MELEVKNILDVHVGDQVVIGVQESSFLKVSFLLYIVPVAGLFTGALFGDWSAPRLGMDPTVSAVVSALVFFAGTLALVRTLGNRLVKDDRYQPRLTKVTHRAQPGG